MISAVVVTYKPNMDKLDKLITSINGQVDNLVIVNNGCLFDLSSKYESFFTSLKIYNLGENKGIGFAQNFGVNKSNLLGSEYSLLLDQDSIVSENMVYELVKGFYDDKIAAVGPTIIDSRTNNKFPYYTYTGIIRNNSLNNPPLLKCFYETDVLISSGTIVNNNIFINNPNNEKLFIEYVDVEWCLRLRSKGFKILFCENITMLHELGDSRERFFGIEFPLHEPFRYYYVVRNGLYCCFNNKFPFSFCSYTFIRTIILMIFVFIKSPSKLSLIKYSLKGLFSIGNIK